VVGAYYDNPESAARFTEDGWFKTGDVATLDGEGYLHITDRTKDLIKSGGEWISSVDVENMIMAHPQRCWALPDEVVFLEGVPKTSVGKFDKKVLRERFKDWSPPAERSS
jgi:fatty-acyl-CoA synthase